MSVAALGTLVWRHPLADVAAKAAAPIGAAFTFLCLVTGSLWGRPMWGTYWVWDARLTSVLVLFLLYLGVIALWRTVEDPARAGARRRDPDAGRRRQPADHQVLGRLVEHAAPAGLGAPPRRPDDPSDDPDAAAGDGAAFLLLFVTLHLAAMRNEILRRRVRTMRLMQAQARRVPRLHESWAACRLHHRRLCAAALVVIRPDRLGLADHAAQRRLLADLEARGVTRRSDKPEAA